MGIHITGKPPYMFLLPQHEVWQFVAVTVLDALTLPLTSTPEALQQLKPLLLHSQFLHAATTTPNGAVQP